MATINGIVTIGSSETPGAATVLLLNEAGDTVLATTVSDSVTGAYSFTGLADGATYRIAVMGGGTYRSKVYGPCSIISDPYFASVVSLLHFDGADGATSIVDQTGRVWTPHGAVALTTGSRKFGTASLSVTGGGDNYFDTPSDASLQLGGGDFTIEAWVRPTTLSPSWNTICIKDYVAGSSYWSYAFALYNGKVRLHVGNGINTATPQALDGATTAVLNVFQHVAAQRRGGNYEVYLGGVLDGSAAISTAVGNATKPLRLGGFADGGTSSFAGQIDEFRITKGVARYSGNFTPPASPFPDS